MLNVSKRISRNIPGSLMISSLMRRPRDPISPSYIRRAMPSTHKDLRSIIKDRIIMTVPSLFTERLQLIDGLSPEDVGR